MYIYIYIIAYLDRNPIIFEFAQGEYCSWYFHIAILKKYSNPSIMNPATIQNYLLMMTNLSTEK